jgi:hypothetical protein
MLISSLFFFHLIVWLFDRRSIDSLHFDEGRKKDFVVLFLMSPDELLIEPVRREKLDVSFFSVIGDFFFRNKTDPLRM